MPHQVLALAATAASILLLERERRLTTILVNEEMRGLDEVHVLDFSYNRLDTVLYISDWLEIDGDLHLFQPVIEGVDHYAEPIEFSETLWSLVNRGTYGCPARSALLVGAEVHLHTAKTLERIDRPEEFQQLVQERITCAKELRNDPSWVAGASALAGTRTQYLEAGSKRRRWRSAPC